jgi:hypothetical protein
MKTTTSVLCLLTIVLLLSSYTFADTPAHCLNSNIAGKWRIKIGQFKSGNTCGFTFPASKTSNYKLTELKALNPSVVDIVLANDHSVTMGLGGANAKFEELVQGVCPGYAGHPDPTWTAIYDEGVNLNFRGISFIGFWQFSLLDDEGNRNLAQDGITENPTFKKAIKAANQEEF